MSIENIIHLSDLLEKEILNTCKELHWLYQGLSYPAYYGFDVGRRSYRTRQVCWLDKDLSHKGRYHFCEQLPPIGYDFHCRFCGVWYSAIWREEVSRIRHRDPVTRKLVPETETRYELGYSTYIDLEVEEHVLPVCSEECYEALGHVMDYYEARVKQEELEKAERARELLKIVKKFELRQKTHERKIKQWESTMTSLQASLIP